MEAKIILFKRANTYSICCKNVKHMYRVKRKNLACCTFVFFSGKINVFSLHQPISFIIL